MKKSTLYFTVFAMMTLIIASCSKSDDEKYDESLLIGKWKSGTLYYKYLSDHTGARWDTGEDITEEEAQPFTWSIVGAELREYHDIDITTRAVPKFYTILELTATSLKYKDETGQKTHSFTRVQ